MKQRFVLAFAVCLACATMAALAGPPVLRMVNIEGWVVDEYCGAKNANADGADCVRECHKKGSELVFATDEGDVYKMDKQSEALEHVGEKIRIMGSIDEEDFLRVGTFLRLKPKEDAKEEEQKDTGS